MRKSHQHDERTVARFVQESQILAKLRHSSIVGVEGLGRFPSGGYFIVMDHVDGSDLQTRLKSGPLPVQEAVSVCVEVASAVRHAHDGGIIHCDLKPANVLIGSSGHVCVTDFGFAYILTDVKLASLQTIGGTAGYIAPEVMKLKSQPTPAADIFALGAMLWTLVTGRIPLSIDELQTNDQDIDSIKAICWRCLANDPADRFPNASELIDALDGVRKR